MIAAQGRWRCLYDSMEYGRACDGGSCEAISRGCHQILRAKWLQRVLANVLSAEKAGDWNLKETDVTANQDKVEFWAASWTFASQD